MIRERTINKRPLEDVQKLWARWSEDSTGSSTRSKDSAKL